jgi:hypothetical protein
MSRDLTDKELETDSRQIVLSEKEKYSRSIAPFIIKGLGFPPKILPAMN